MNVSILFSLVTYTSHFLFRNNFILMMLSLYGNISLDIPYFFFLIYTRVVKKNSKLPTDFRFVVYL